MDKPTPKTGLIATGLAMFSMFFGAGNIVFPLDLGLYAQSQNLFAILGMLITAVGVPFVGLISITLFNGNYKQFFERIGVVPGFILMTAIMGLIGPFGAIPRCITLSFATMSVYLPNLSLPLFSIVSCVLIYLLTFRKTNIVDILGYFLTPFLIFSLIVIIIKGLMTGPAIPESSHSFLDIFSKGLLEGYQTMDLLGAFFFSSIVLNCLESDADAINPNEHKNYRKMIMLTLKASVIGVVLLSLTYIGFSYTAAIHSESLAGIPKDELLAKIAILILGPYAGIIACVAAALACLTTAIALAAVFAEFVHNDVTQGKVNYNTAIILTLIVSFFVSTLHFTGIAQFLTPILQISYPALILLSILNIAYKLFHFKPVKAPFFTVFAVSLFAWLYNAF